MRFNMAPCFLDVQTGKSSGMVPVLYLALPKFEIPSALNVSHAR